MYLDEQVFQISFAIGQQEATVVDVTIVAVDIYFFTFYSID